MKRKILAIVGILVFALFLFPQNVSAAEQLDQQCNAVPDEQVPSGGGSMYQTFKPAFDRLTKISVYIGDENRSDTLALQNEGGTTINSASLTVSVVNWYTFTFSQVSEVTSGATYRIAITTPQIMTTWGNVHTGCYANGQAYLNGGTYGGDWLFQTYGYNYSSGTTQGTSDQGTGTATTPSSTTSSSIVKPTSPKGEYLADQKGVKVTWGKSTTTDIDGYRIYRSEEKTKGFAKVGEVNKTTLEYLDKTVTGEKTFYYYIRAYKGTTESNSSDTITVVVPKIEVAAAKDESVIETAESQPPTFLDTLKLYWLPISLGGFGVLLLLGITFWKVILPKIRARKQLE